MAIFEVLLFHLCVNFGRVRLFRCFVRSLVDGNVLGGNFWVGNLGCSFWDVFL